MASLLPTLEGLLTVHNITTVLIVVVVFLLSLALLSRSRIDRGRNFPPGPPGWPVLGNLPSLANNAHLQLTAWRSTYGDVFRVKMGLQDAVVVCGRDAIREALVRKAQHFSDRPDLFLMRLVGHNNGLIMRPYGDQWKNLRRFLVSTIRSCGIGTGIMEENIKTECRHYCNELKKKLDQPFDVKHHLHNAVANIICSMAIGKRFEYGDPTFIRLTELVDRIMVLMIDGHVINLYPVLRYFPVLGRLYTEWMDVTREGQNTMKGLIAEHKTKETSSNEANDLIDAFTKSLELNPHSVPDQSLAHLIDDLFAAGTDTTTTTLRWGLLYLATYPDVQTKVQAELDEVIGRDRPPALSDRASLPYTEATLLEMQRIRTAVPLSIPRFTSTDSTLLGYDIPAGTDVIINLWSVHMDPSHWNNPEQFDPSRFLDDKGQLLTNDSIIPLNFSTGRRVCPGAQLAKMMLFLLLTNMLQQFTFTLPEGAQPSFDGILGATLRPQLFKLIASSRA